MDVQTDSTAPQEIELLFPVPIKHLPSGCSIHSSHPTIFFVSIGALDFIKPDLNKEPFVWNDKDGN